MRDQEGPDDDAGVRERLHRLLTEHSQSDIARKTGTGVAAVNRYVHGARIPAAFCSSLVRGLGVNPAWLLMGEGSPYLADVPEQTARLGENMLELVEAMSAVSKMLLGSLTGKHHLKVLRELNEALLSHERLRESMNSRSRPVFERILQDLQGALEKLDLERASELHKAATQVSRLCDDEGLARDFLRVSAFYEFQRKRADRFLDYQRKLFLRSLPDGKLFDERACDEGRRIVVALTQMHHVREAMRICRAIRALAGHRGRKWEAFHRLENTFGVLMAESGNLRKGLELIERSLPRLSGMYRKVSEAALVRMLIWGGALTIFDALNVGEPTDAKAQHFVRYAAWLLDPKAIKAALQYSRQQGLSPVWKGENFVGIAGILLEQLESPSAPNVQAIEDQDADNNGDAEVSPWLRFVNTAEAYRVAGDRKRARERIIAANELRVNMDPEVLPPPMDEATAHRATLDLLQDDKTQRPAVQRARTYFKRRVARGFLCFEPVLAGHYGIKN
ncbi:MAG: helix-turn-helix transcriptional regulator [Planctomycetes bacterium]|nr:helix-turn-helix transcriptional regulator [Planctomycetota bacterium]MCW8135583.1 helix-turn-helix transcriptional regulator [Planctomycetota bacterium]